MLACDLLRYYMVYRALVRAKVAAMRAAQSSVERRPSRPPPGQVPHAYRARPPVDRQAAARGLSSCTDCRAQVRLLFRRVVLETVGALRVRSDVERKRLHGLAAAARSGSELGKGLYAPSASQATYDRLNQLAAAILEAGYPVVVDATFLEQEQRERFRTLAATHACCLRNTRRPGCGGDAAEAHCAAHRGRCRCIRSKRGRARSPACGRRTAD